MSTQTVTSEQSKIVYRKYIEEIFNKGQLDRLKELVSPSYIYHDAPPGTPHGPEGIKQIVASFREAFPDFKITIEDQVAEGEKVCSRTTTTGTPQGTIFGIKATNKRMVMKGMTMARIEDGRVMESWVNNDMMGFMKQLGA